MVITKALLICLNSDFPASTETKTKRLKVKYLGFKTNDDELRTGFSVSGKLAFETCKLACTVMIFLHSI